MFKNPVFVILLLIVCNVQAQISNDSIRTNIEPTVIISNYFKYNPPKDQTDSLFISSYKYLDQFTNGRSTKESIAFLQQFIFENRPESELSNLNNFRIKVDSLNALRKKVLTDYWENKRLQSIADTIEISSTDSIFSEALELMTNQDTLDVDSILNVLHPYDDTLLIAINDMIDGFRHHDYLEWIRNIRNDSINIYLVNIAGDSLPIKLYKNNPNLIRFDLTDFWGTKIPAVIRNIERRSFKILIDDTPEINYETDKQAKDAMGKMGKIGTKRKLTVKQIPIEIRRPLWLKGGNFSFNISQVGMHQWAQGGDPSLSILSGVDLFAKYKNKNISWDNNAKLRFGVIRQGRYTEPSIGFRSSEDRIELASKYGYNVFGKFYISLEGDFKSQFAPAYSWTGNTKSDILISKFMSPGYLTFSFGLDYKPDENTTLFLAPISSKTTAVLYDSVSVKKRYGVDPESNFRYEVGARLKVLHKTTVWDNIELKNSIELFSSYIENPQNIDINWEMNIIFPVNNFIKATITANYIYDDDTGVPKYTLNEDTGLEEKYEGKGGQFREMIAIGLTFKF